MNYGSLFKLFFFNFYFSSFFFHFHFSPLFYFFISFPPTHTFIFILIFCFAYHFFQSDRF